MADHQCKGHYRHSGAGSAGAVGQGPGCDDGQQDEAGEQISPQGDAVGRACTPYLADGRNNADRYLYYFYYARNDQLYEYHGSVSDEEPQGPHHEQSGEYTGDPES